jgi:hypothetical protein
MKRLALVLALAGVAALAAACNDAGSLVGAPEPEPDETPGPDPDPEPEPSPMPTLPPTPGDIEIVAAWDAAGDDWELHLVKPGGQINDNATDCTWTSCVTASPDWGAAGDPADDPHKDYDDLDQYGPERIWLAFPEPGTYTIYVEHWGTGFPESDGTVTIGVVGQPLVTVSMMNLAPQHVWTVGTITWPSGIVTPSQDVYDCTATWDFGCPAILP